MELAQKVQSRHVWQLAWPNIVSTLMLTSIGLAHIKIVAHYGADAVAAVSTGHRVYFLLQALLIGLSAATTALVARHWGSGDYRAAAQSGRASINLSVTSSIVLGAAFFFLAKPIALTFGLEPEPAELASRFIRVMVLFNVFYAISIILSTAIRSTGDVKTPMNYSMVSTAINVLLCLVLVNGWGTLPELGPTGAALAGGIAPLLVYSFLTWKWMRGQVKIPYSPDAGDDYRTLVKIGAPAALEQCVIQVSLMLFMALVSHYGTAAYAAYALGITLLSAVIVVGYGFGIAGATLVAQYLGAGNREEARSSARRTMVMALITMSTMAALCFIYAEELSRFMIDDPAVIEVSVQFMWVLSLVLPLMAIEVSIAGVLRGAGDTRTPLAATFSGLSTRLLGGLLVIYLELPVFWLFATLFADYTMKASILAYRYRSGRWAHSAASSQKA